MERFDEAIQHARVFQQLDPLNVLAHSFAGYVYARAGHYAQGIEECNKALEIDADSFVALWILGQVHTRAQAYVEAIDMLERAVELSGRKSFFLGILGTAHASAGKITEAGEIAVELERRFQSEYVDAASVAGIYAALGNVDVAFDWLNRAYAQHSCTLVTAKIDMRWTNLRHDARFIDLLRKVGLA